MKQILFPLLLSGLLFSCPDSGGENEAVIQNRNIHYIYNGQKLHLVR